MVDTGATLVALTYEDAERAGIYLRPADFNNSVSTANGTAKVASVMIGSVNTPLYGLCQPTRHRYQARKLHRTLLGMTFLSKLNVEMRKNVLVLRQ